MFQATGYFHPQYGQRLGTYQIILLVNKCGNM